MIQFRWPAPLFLLALFIPIDMLVAQDNRDVALAEQSVGRVETYGYNRANREIVVSRGSGFAVNENVIVTNAHVVKDFFVFAARPIYG